MNYTIITSSDPIMTFIYYLGLVVCIAAGYEKGRAYLRFPLIFQIINSFNGGVTRDLLCLHTRAWFFTNEAIPDILFVLIVGAIYAFVSERVKNTKAKAINDSVIDIMDAISLGSFISIGADKALDLGFSLPTAIICAYVTGCFGGLTAYFMNPKAILTLPNLYYQIVALLGSILYCHIRNGYLACFSIAFCLLASKVDYAIILTYNRSEYLYTLTKINLSARICSLRAFFANAAARATDYFYLKRVARYYRVYLAFHRLRIC